jgi:hypothetical protein
MTDSSEVQSLKADNKTESSQAVSRRCWGYALQNNRTLAAGPLAQWHSTLCATAALSQPLAREEPLHCTSVPLQVCQSSIPLHDAFCKSGGH